MKICPKCNASWEDDVKFCSACGESLSEVQTSEQPAAPAAEPAAPATEPAAPAAEPVAPVAPVPPTYQPPAGYGAQRSGEEPLSTGKWLLYQLIPLIPFVGSLVYIVMLFVWSFGDNAKNETFRNWARSNLILMGISLVLCILMVVLVVVFSVGIFGALEGAGSYENW